jgi:hypothetical protein
MVKAHSAVAHLEDMRNRALMCMADWSERRGKHETEAWNLQDWTAVTLAKMLTIACVCMRAVFGTSSV